MATIGEKGGNLGDIFECRSKAVELNNIKKHRNDIIRLTQTLSLEVFEIPESIKSDLRTFLEHPDIAALTTTTIESILETGFTVEQARTTLREHFALGKE